MLCTWCTEQAVVGSEGSEASLQSQSLQPLFQLSIDFLDGCCLQDMSTVPHSMMTARREAAAKIAENRDALIKVVMHGSGKVKASGVVHAMGSVYGSHVQEVDGKTVNPFEVEVAAVVEQALQRLCVYLLTGDVGTSPEDQEASAIQVVTLSYLRNLASSPRDMTAEAAKQYRQACDTLLQKAYLFA